MPHKHKHKWQVKNYWNCTSQSPPINPFCFSDRLLLDTKKDTCTRPNPTKKKKRKHASLLSYFMGTIPALKQTIRKFLHQHLPKRSCQLFSLFIFFTTATTKHICILVFRSSEYFKDFTVHSELAVCEVLSRPLILTTTDLTLSSDLTNHPEL